MIAVLLTRPPELTIKSASWPILFDHAALLEAERLTGLDVLAGELDLWRPSVRVLRAALFASLKSAGWNGTLADAGAILSPARLAGVRETLMIAWAASMPQQDEDEEDAPTEEPAEKPKRKNWLEVWAIARYDLRLSDAEWLKMTPRMVEHLMRRQLAGMRQQEMQTGIIAANVVTFSGRAKDAAKPEQFMLHPIRRKYKPQTIDELRGIFSCFAKAG